MHRFIHTILSRGTGLALPDALITVYLTGTTTKASLYNLNVVSPANLIANPVTTNAFGEVDFYTPDGVYDLRIDKGSEATRTIPEVEIFDLKNIVVSAGGVTNPNLIAIAGLITGNNRLPYFVGSGAAALTDLTNFARTLIDDVDNVMARATLGLVIGTDVQAYDSDLAAVAALTTAGFGLGLLTQTTAAAVRAYIGAGSGAGDLLSTNNLSDVTNVATARVNLGLATYILSTFATTTPTASEVLMLAVAGAAFTIPANFTAALRSTVGVNPTASFVLDVQNNGTTIGTITISTGGVVTATTVGGTSKAIAVSDVIKIVAPAVADTTAANIGLTIVGVR